MLIAVLLVTGVFGVIDVSHHGAATVVITRGESAAAAQSHGNALATSGAAATSGTTELPPTADPGTGTGTTVPSTSTSVAVPPTTHGQRGTTTVPPSRTTAPTATAPAAAGPATGRLAVTLTVVRGGGVGVGGGIATMEADGSNRQVLVSGNYFVPQWTPDGRFIVFLSSDSYAAWAVAATGGPVTRLAADVAGQISPDGTRVTRGAGAPGSTPAPLVVQPVAESGSGLVANGPASPLGVSGFHPLWSPDGRRVVYATEFGPKSDLAVVDADGTNPRDLLASAPVGALLLSPPGFSADGSTVSFIGTDNRAYFIDADGRNLRPALPDVVPGISNVSAFSTAWSPDHHRLAVLIDGANTVVVVDTARHLLASLHLPVPGTPTGLAFDGSGQHIYYMGSPSPPRVSNLYSIALDGSRSHQLSTDGSILDAPTVLP